MREGNTGKLNISKSVILLAVAILFFIVSLLSVSYALFQVTTSNKADFTLGTVEIVPTEEVGLSELRNPGDSKDITINLRNNGNADIRYQVTMIPDVNDGGLASVLFVYWDGKLLGTLKDLTTGKLGTYDEGGVVPAFLSGEMGMQELYLTPGEDVSHILTIEYHIGARAITATSGRTATIRLEASWENTDLENEVIVRDFYELEQAFALCNFGILQQKKIILGGNIDVNKTISISNMPVACERLFLDLNGHSLNIVGTNSISLAGNVKLIIEDSKGLYHLNGGTISVSGTQAMVAGEAFYHYSGSFHLAEYTPEDATVAMLFDEYIVPRAKKNLEVGIVAGAEPIDFLGGYSKYGVVLELVIPNYIRDYFNYTSNDGKIAVLQNKTDGTNSASITHAVTNRIVTITVKGRGISFEIVGNGEESIISVLENKYLHMIKGSNANTTTIFYDILLPQRFKEYNCTVEWASSNPNVLDETGNYNSPWITEDVTLFAVYTINDKVYTREYPVKVKGYSYEEKASYFMAHFGTVTFNIIPQERTLWFADDYIADSRCNKDLDISSIEYTIPTEYSSFLKLKYDENTGKYALRLDTSSTEFECHINVKLTFNTPPALGSIPSTSNIVEKQIPVFIRLDDYTTTEDLYSYVKASIAEQLEKTEFESPVDFYDLLTLVPGAENYKRKFILPAYYEVKGSAVDEFGIEQEFTIAIHEIHYRLPNEVRGAAPTDADGDYDKAKSGTTDIEYVNDINALAAVNLTSVAGTINGASVTKEGITHYELEVNEVMLLADDMKLNVIACLGTPFEGMTTSTGEFRNATPQDRRNIEFILPGVLDQYLVNGDNEVFNGDLVFSYIDAAARAKNLATVGRDYVFIRDLWEITDLDFDTYINDENMKYLDLFVNLETLDISAVRDENDNLVKNDVTSATMKKLSELYNLRELRADNCKIENINALEKLHNLEKVSLNGNSDLKSVSALRDSAETLEQLDTRNTSCGEIENEWIYAYCYYKYRDAKVGDKPILYINADNTPDVTEKLYDVEYQLEDRPDAFKKYRRLVYGNAKFANIHQAEAIGEYIWMPKMMIEAVGVTDSSNPAYIYTTSTWGSANSVLTVTNYDPDSSSDYRGNYARISNSGDTGILTHSLKDTDTVSYIEQVKTEVEITDPDTGEPIIDPDTGLPQTEIVIVEEERTREEEIISTRYFYIDIIR